MEGYYLRLSVETINKRALIGDIALQPKKKQMMMDLKALSIV